MQTLIAHFVDRLQPKEASYRLRTQAVPLSDKEVDNLFPDDPDRLTWYGKVFLITVPKVDAKSRLTKHVFQSTGEGYETFGDRGGPPDVFYKPVSVQSQPGVGGKRRAKKTLRKKRKLTRKSRKRA